MLRFDATKRPARNYFSRREQWRLLLLVMSLGVVVLMMREVREPGNVARVAQVFAGGETLSDSKAQVPIKPGTPKPSSGSFQSTALDNSKAASPANSNPATGRPKLTELLSLAGWTPQRFAKFTDDQPLTDAERNELIQLLWRVRTFDAAMFEQIDNAQKPSPGAMVRFTGRVKNIERHELAGDDAARFEIPAYYICELELEADGGQAVLITANVPRPWERIATLDEPVSAAGLFVKHLPAKGAQPGAQKPVYLAVAKRIAWHPTTPGEPAVSFGMSILGSLGMDVGLLDEVRSHGRFETGDAAQRARLNDEREAFYQMLDAVERIGANQLIRFANANLDTVRRQWAQEMSVTNDPKRRRLAQEVLKRAKQGRYSVAPLFNDAPRQIGRLFVVDGAARRAVRVDVGSRSDGAASDVARRFGIDHYYELEVFTDDSQNYPLVFCVRELPAAVPVGDDLHVPVRVAGFFFKDWLYTTRGTREVATGDLIPEGGKPQYAPLLIGRGPLILRVDEPGRGMAQLVGGGLFLLALGGIWAAAWWLARGDRQFIERRRQAAHSLLPGQSLNNLNVPAAAEPIKLEEGGEG